MEFDCQESPFTPPDCKLTGSEVLDQFGLVPFAASFWLNEIVIASLGLVFLANGYFLFAWRSRPLMKLK